MAGAVVVDTSFAAAWGLEEPQTPVARVLLAEWEQQRVAWLAPSLFLSEINTPILKLRRLGLMTAADATRAIYNILAAVTVLPNAPELTRRAFEIADSLALRTAHDSLFVALAEQEGCELWTADERFWIAARARYPRVRWVGTISLAGP
jgi:predicted nucleic acid-binding protein